MIYTLQSGTAGAATTSALSIFSAQQFYCGSAIQKLPLTRQPHFFRLMPEAWQ